MHAFPRRDEIAEMSWQSDMKGSSLFSVRRIARRAARERDGNPARTNAKYRAQREKVCRARDRPGKPSRIPTVALAAYAAGFPLTFWPSAA